MKILYHPVFLDHDPGPHPESPQRLKGFTHIPQAEIPSGESYLTLFHTPEYVSHVKDACDMSSYLDADTKVSPGSYNAAVHAVGATVLASQTGDFALVRPPGHHAHPQKSGGFCLFNNIAIAVQKLVNEDKKVLIIDFDGHTGDGTEQFFYRSNRVMYCSFHQEGVFPGVGFTRDIGEGQGKGYTINIPVPAGSGDDVAKLCLDTATPYWRSFAPDIVAVSAGFDGYMKDPLLHLRYSLNTYFAIGLTIRSICPQSFAVLEGGYNTDELPKLVDSFVAGVNGMTKPHDQEPTDSPILVLETVGTRLEELKSFLSPVWKP